MSKSTTALDEQASNMPAGTRRALPVPAIRNLKRTTWYYGVRCACECVLALCEDIFAGKGEDAFVVQVPVSVECQCGTVTTTSILEKFKAP